MLSTFENIQKYDKRLTATQLHEMKKARYFNRPLRFKILVRFLLMDYDRSSLNYRCRICIVSSSSETVLYYRVRIETNTSARTAAMGSPEIKNRTPLKKVRLRYRQSTGNSALLALPLDMVSQKCGIWDKHLLVMCRPKHHTPDIQNGVSFCLQLLWQVTRKGYPYQT